jgi:3-dehydroquinate synthase
MEKITINTPSKNYPVYIGDQAITKLLPFLKALDPTPKNVLIISDKNVANLYLDHIQDLLTDFISIETFILPPGDNQKSFANYYDCLTFALQKGLDRTSVIIALGGGMIGDFSGFVAGTFMRGIRFLQIPTTILAHDSAVGGKTGINHPEGKNMIGVFHQPEAVFFSTEYLDTLPDNEIRSGFAEVIKHALIYDREFYKWLRLHITSIDKLKKSCLTTSLIRGIEIKNKVVTQDETEKGLRAILNFGHTLAHAIEAELHYKGITHGEAVAHGMLFALSLTRETELLEQELRSWLEDLGYKALPSDLSIPSLIDRMKKDKKSISGSVHMVLLNDIGSPYLKKISEDLLQEKLTKFLS